MRLTAAAVVFSCLAFLGAGVGDRFRFVSRPGVVAPVHLGRLWAWGETAFRAGRYEEAAGAFRAAARHARRMGLSGFEAQCLNNVGGAWLASFQFREAIEAYLEARELAERGKDWKTASAISSNLATVYAQMGDPDAARAEAERALDLARRASHRDPRLLLRVATLRSVEGKLDAALHLFDEAARLADGGMDVATAAQIWRILAHAYLRAGRIAEAEAAALEAYRLHRLRGAPDAYLAYRALALVRGAEGDLAAAERLLDLALEHARHAVLRLPHWSLYYERGNLRRRRGKLEEALADFRLAVDLARRWRLEVLPVETFAVSVDARLHELYAALAETAAELALRQNSPALVREALEAAEENRAASLRARLGADVQVAPPPPAYAELLRQLHTLEMAQARRANPALAARLAEIRRRLIALEMREGLRLEAATSFRWERGAPLLVRLQRALGNDEAYLAFHLGDARSYRWCVTKRELQMAVLPPRSEIARAVSAFSSRLEEGLNFPAREGERLYRQLFGGLSAEALEKRIWFLGPDVDLFFVPMAALPTGEHDNRPAYLVEQRAIQIVPGANLLKPAQPGAWRGSFLGVADPVYNRADARWAGPSGKVAGRLGGWLAPSAQAAGPNVELPRLPGSGHEVHACARVWGGTPVVLEGAKARVQELRSALSSEPDVLHFAAHVVETEPRRGRVAIVLSLGPDGLPELLDPDAIRNLRPAPGMVVLSGCRSAGAAVLPGAGLLGLTRAWLLAGSRAVVASLWPVPDERGELFVSFYRCLAPLSRYGTRAPALALRQAQLEMLACTDRLAHPGYWASYVLTGVP